MKKRIVALIVVCSMVVSMTACTKKDEAKAPESGSAVSSTGSVSEDAVLDLSQLDMSDAEPTQENEDTGGEDAGDEVTAEMIHQDAVDAFNEHDAFSFSLMQYLKNAHEDRNFMVSPLSLKAALCLAIAGADGETLQQLLDATGFASMDDAVSWYHSMIASTDDFNAGVEELKEMDPDVSMGYSIANSVWNNTDHFSFKESYVNDVKDLFGADAYEASSDQITDKINAWCDEETKGMIPKIANDVSEFPAVLVNALYFKTSWMTPFDKGRTSMGTFNCFDGSTKETEFMEVTDCFGYYEDEDCQMVVIPMTGNKMFIAVLGDASNLDDKLMSYSYVDVHVKMPKLNFESSFDGLDLISFLNTRGATSAFNDEQANFSKMTDDVKKWYIGDILQKTKINADEDGIEAAAATAIVMKDNGIMQVGSEPVEFIADKPFDFYIMDGYDFDMHEFMFTGQYVAP